MRSFLQCRRGSVALATVIALVPLIGFIALGAEAGSWYVTKQHAQNAADAAAYSGGLRLACLLSGSSACETTQSPPDYVYRGKQFADRNGFCDTRDTSYACNSTPPAGTTHTVQIDRGTYASGAWTTSASGNFIRASASQQQSGYLAAVLGFTTINIGAQAIVEVKNPKNLCGLGIGPSAPALTIGGSSTITGTGCGLMSDTSVKYNSAPSFSGSDWAVNAVNGCVASAGHCALSVPYNYNALPAKNPLAVLNSESFNTTPTITGNSSPTTSCPSPPPAGATQCVNENTAGTAYGKLTANTGDYFVFVPKVAGTQGTYYFTKNFTVNGGTIDLAPGTYFFKDSAVSLGGTVTCSTCTSWTGTGLGVTLVLLGNSSLSITGNVSLSAPKTNTFSSDLNGVLIDDQATGNSNNVTINGGTVSLGGAMYFPYVSVTWGGNVQSSTTTCTEVVANSLTINGNAYLSSSGCTGNAVFKSQVVALVN
ncbi:pilus assembly protein TadG [Bradyrhizobium sp. KB893862 SZCCT0404]|uniref:pilus assembly protein TadG-related protein n=1 Tax=Bradyrhizobium sp. KB893862 SZCCT0404 TaxID=2807672 RepID=UPI001BAC921C|nr:pilus assembly protein TadG [Bradyrhizobium sp. KB893862 SZCCT0404]